MSIPAISFLRIGRPVLTAALAVLLASCGGGGNPTPPAPTDALALFNQQKLDWQACDPSLFDDSLVYIKELGARVTCASMRAPLDYNNPALGELQVALMRAGAEQPQQRLGAILFNPGGPGNDGLTLGARFASLFAIANPANPTGKLLKDMGGRYDLIGFSPRGVGASTTLTCVSSYLTQLTNDPTFDRSLANTQNIRSNERLEAETCAKNPLTKHIHTDATARDMDLVRRLMGEEKLNYIGFSYGTWLGAWYASLFPDRVGRMLLDSSMNVAGTFDDAKLLQQMGKQRVMAEVMFPYAARNPKLFNLGDNAGQIQARLLGLPPTIKSSVVASLNFNKAQDVDESLLHITAAFGLQALRDAMPGADPRSIDAAIQTYAFTQGANNAKAASLAAQLNRALLEVPQRGPVALEPQSASRISVTCNDLATTGDELYWLGVGNEYAARYPLTGNFGTNHCLYWGAPYGPRPPLANAAKAAPLLMLQSRRDALTPIEGALKTLDALPNASMIVIENEYGHGLFPYDEGCVAAQVAGYFVNGTVPPRISSCAGKPLPADVPLATTPKSSKKAGVAPETKTYTDPARAELLRQGIHKRIPDTL